MKIVSNETNQPMVGELELILKLGGLILGTLYVLGLLISNIQLMSLGVVDFSSLHVRNILTGALFSFYVALLFLSISPVPVSICILWQIVLSDAGKKWLKVTLVLIICLLAMFFFISLVGTILGYLYPWGRSWDGGMYFRRATWKWSSMWSDSLSVIVQFLDTYHHPKSIAAAICIVLGTLPFANWLVRRSFIKPVAAIETIADVESSEVLEPSMSVSPLTSESTILSAVPNDQTVETRFLARFFAVSRIVIVTTYLPIAILLLIVSFADHAYPNMENNLGGGQPQVAELHSIQENTSKMALVAIWYQSDKFLYVSPLPDSGRCISQLDAVDLGLVRNIHYVRKYVRVESDGSILTVCSYKK